MQANATTARTSRVAYAVAHAVAMKHMNSNASVKLMTSLTN
jgi:hypothetical protein